MVESKTEADLEREFEEEVEATRQLEAQLKADYESKGENTPVEEKASGPRKRGPPQRKKASVTLIQF